MIIAIADLIRVIGAFGLLYAALPYMAQRRPGENRLQRLAESFTATMLFFEILALALGRIGFCLRGSVTVAYSGFLVAAFLMAGRGRSLAVREWWRNRCHWALERLEGVRSGNRARLRWRLRWPLRPAMCALLVATFSCAAWYPLTNIRFQKIDSYARALSLEVLARGQAWEPNGSVAFLAPVVFVSGLHGDAVVRYSNVALAVALALAAGFAAFRHTRSETSALLAMSTAAAFAVGSRGTPEMSAAEIAAIFWLLALGFAGRSRWYCFLSASLGFLISLTPDWRSVLLFATVCGIIASSRVLARRTGLMPRLPKTAALAVLAWAVCQPANMANGHGPYQYESAARTVARIASECQPNDWLIVSPVHEIPLLYGRGWHVELMEFVNTFSPRQLSDPGFRFPYAPKDIFVFVEKAPLRVSGVEERVSLMHELDISVQTYQSSLGRSAVEFLAGRLMASYAGSHEGISIYFEDEQMIVYHVRAA